MSNLQANLDLIDEQLSLAYFTLQKARSHIYEGRELSCAFSKDWPVIAKSIDASLDLITELEKKLQANKELALSGTRTNQSLQGESTK